MNDKLTVSSSFSGPELCAYEAHELVMLLRRREITPTELLEAAYTRIASVDPTINAMPTLCRDRAQAQLAVWDGGDPKQPGWLGGIPTGIKDLTPVAGVRTSYGTVGLADFVPEISDPLVERLEQRGGVVIGKTNTPEMGAGANTFNDVFGRTCNPWNCNRNAGGSSGGSAAALATGEIWLGHGSDLAGSLRTPAAYCGVVGLRPSPGIAGGGPEGLEFSCEGVQGPMARSVMDCALFLDAMAGFEPRHPLSYPAPEVSYQEAVRQADERVRIGYAPDLGGFAPVSASVEAHLRKSLIKVAQQGGMVEEACPDLPNLERTYRVLRAMVWAAGPGRAPQAIQQHYKATLTDNIEAGRNLTPDEIYDAGRDRTILFHNMRQFLENFDVLACPVVGLAAGPLEEEYPTEMDGQPLVDYISWLRFSFLAPTISLPAISVPIGCDAAGMPVGIQLIGPPRGEAKLLAVARAVERANGGPLGPIDPIG